MGIQNDKMNQSNISPREIQKQRNEWKKKRWSIPNIGGSKHSRYQLVIRLIELVNAGQASDLDSLPDVADITQPQAWRNYASFLTGVRLVKNQSGNLLLSEIGLNFLSQSSQQGLANLIQDNYRLFGETLNFLNIESATVEELNRKLCNDYELNWENLNNIRSRIDWLDALGLIRAIGNRKWEVTDIGKLALDDWYLVTPEAIDYADMALNDMEITPPPEEIAVLL